MGSRKVRDLGLVRTVTDERWWSVFTGAVSRERRDTSLIVLEDVLTSSRRVRKGPGVRPQSPKRRRFMELRARGWSIKAALQERWARGARFRRGERPQPGAAINVAPSPWPTR